MARGFLVATLLVFAGSASIGAQARFTVATDETITEPTPEN
jgi:hypothetical protein